MKSCRSSLLFLTITAGFLSAHPTVKVELNSTAVLPCSDRCSGVVRWSMFSKADDVLAECDRTSCRSVKEGYQMVHEDYLKGTLSLFISGADFSKRGWYVCDCDGTDLCDVTLQIEPLKTQIQKQPGESLLLDVDVSEPVEVVYKGTGAAGPSSGQICTVDGRTLWCSPEYTQRTSLRSGVELRGVKESDSGVYAVRDTRNDEDIIIYSVTVQDGGDGGDGSEALGLDLKLSRSRRSAESNSPPCECKDPDAGVPLWVVVLLVVLLLAALAVIVGAVVVNLRLKRENQKLRRGPENGGVQQEKNGALQEQNGVRLEKNGALLEQNGALQEENGVEADGDVTDHPEEQRLADSPV